MVILHMHESLDVGTIMVRELHGHRLQECQMYTREQMLILVTSRKQAIR